MLYTYIAVVYYDIAFGRIITIETYFPNDYVCNDVMMDPMAIHFLMGTYITTVVIF